MAIIPTWIPQDGPCEYCKAKALKPLAIEEGTFRRAKPCDDCGKAIPIYPGMGGSGYESQTVGHFHLEAMGSQIGRTPIMRELCEACYKADYAIAFPDAGPPF